MIPFYVNDAGPCAFEWWDGSTAKVALWCRRSNLIFLTVTNCLTSVQILIQKIIAGAPDLRWKVVKRVGV